MIRPYEPSDRAAVVELWSAIFPDDPPWNAPELIIDRKRSVQPDLFLVAEIDGVVIGTVVAGFDGVRGWVHHLAVHPGRRLAGIGAELMRSAEQGLVELGCPKLNLQIRASNDGVVAFYERLGYSIEDRISMGKRL